MITFTDRIPIAVVDAWLITVLIMILANFDKLVRFWKRRIANKEGGEMKRYLISVLVLVFVLNFCLPVFASDEVDIVNTIIVNTIEEEDSIKQEYAYAYAYISPGRLIQYQLGSNNQIFVSQASAVDYAKIQQIGNSNTAIVVQH